MIANLLFVLLKSSLPIAATTFGLIWWAQRKGYLGGAASLQEYELWKKAEDQSRKADKKRRKEEKRTAKQKGSPAVSVADVTPAIERKFDPLHSKWMQFGGGFYGVVAFFTYVVIELADVRDFVFSLPELTTHGLIKLLVNLLVESMKNFVTAIAWPGYWLSRIHSEQWLWIIGAYAGYWLGAKAAFRFGARLPS